MEKGRLVQYVFFELVTSTPDLNDTHNFFPLRYRFCFWIQFSMAKTRERVMSKKCKSDKASIFYILMPFFSRWRNNRSSMVATSLSLWCPILVGTFFSRFATDGPRSCFVYRNGVIQRIVISDAPIFIDRHKLFFLVGVGWPVRNTFPHWHSVWCWIPVFGERRPHL